MKTGSLPANGTEKIAVFAPYLSSMVMSDTAMLALFSQSNLPAVKHHDDKKRWYTGHSITPDADNERVMAVSWSVNGKPSEGRYNANDASLDISPLCKK
jgi:hypothetical protein